jgi:hypothetical protein
VLSDHHTTEGKPVVSDWRARTRVEEYLRKECPIALALLEPAAGYVDTDCLFYRLTPKHRQRFEDLSASPLIDHLARAATQIKQAISVAIKDSATEFEHEIRIRRTPRGIEAARYIRDRQQGANERTEWLRLYD